MKKYSLPDNPPLLLVFVLVLVLPFEYLGSWEVGGYTLRLSQIVLLGIFVLFPFYGSIRLKPWVLLFFLFFLIINLLGLLNTPDLFRSVMVLSVTVCTCSLAFFLPAILKKKDIPFLIELYLFSAFLVCVFGVYQFLGDLLNLPHWLTGIRDTYSKHILGFPRMQATFSEPLYFGNYLLFPLCLGILRFLQTKQRKYLGYVLLFSACVLLTVSRGAILAHLVSVSVLFLGVRQTFPWIKKHLVLLSIPLFLMGFWVIFLSFDRIQPFVLHLFNWFDGAAFVERENTFNQASSLFWSHPLVGWGPGSFGPVSLHTTDRPHTGWPIVNNQYLETLVENGLLGFICVFGFFLTVLKQKKEELPFWAAKCALLGVLVQYFTFSTLYFLPLWFLIGFLLI